MAPKKQHTDKELTEDEKSEEWSETHPEEEIVQKTESVPPSGGQETVDQLLARWEGYLQSDRDGYSHFIDNPNTLVGARYEVLKDHVRDLKAALGKA